MSRRRYSYVCVDCSKLIETSSKTSYICRSCLARRNAKKGNDASVIARTLRPYEALYRTFVRTAKKAKHVVKISYEQFVELTKNKNCFYCKRKLYWAKKSIKGRMTYNLDRKNSRLDYTLDNCVPCCAKCNRIKMDYFEWDEFLAIVELVKEWRGKW